jgi:hypothetical protein
MTRRAVLRKMPSPQSGSFELPACGAPERDNKWPDGTRVRVRNKPKSWSEATIYTRLDAEYWRVQYPPAAPASCHHRLAGPAIRFNKSGMEVLKRNSRIPYRAELTKLQYSGA